MFKPLGIFCRFKTFRATPTKAFKRKLAEIQYKKANNIPVASSANLKETKFFKVVGPMKIYKSLSPGLTNKRHPTRFHLHKKSCVKRLSYGKRSTGGRNNTGRITIRHRGGGHKKRVRIIDFKRCGASEHRVERFEYDPNRNAELMLVRNMSTNELSYVLRVIGVKVGQLIYNYGDGVPVASPGQSCLSKADLIKEGNCLPIRSIPVGTSVNSISLKPGGPAKFCRAAGTFAQILSITPSGHCQLKLSSQEIRLVRLDCSAVIGRVANELDKLKNWGKAGARRRKGWRPSVRGIAMNPNDHPHGGGRKSKGGKAARSPWGWLTKGPKSVKRKKWFVVVSRHKAKK